MVRKRARILGLLLAVAMTCALIWGVWAYHGHLKRNAYKSSGRPEVRQALQIVSRPGWESSASGWSCQTGLRLALMLHDYSDLMHYVFQPEDAVVWKGLLQDDEASRYGRDCAAFFLLDLDQEARIWLETEMRQEKARWRFNAATVLSIYLQETIQLDGDRPTLEWAKIQAIDLLDKGFLDHIEGAGRSPILSGQGKEQDSTDILHSPLWDICSTLGYFKEKRAVNALVKHLRRCPHTPSAASALGQIGDPRGIPVLLHILKNKTGYDLSEANALAALGCQEAIPIMGQLLVELTQEEPDALKRSGAMMDADRLLDALLQMRNRTAVGFIQSFVQKCADPKERARAERVLAHLELNAPVRRLIELFDAAGMETKQAGGSSARTVPLNTFIDPGGDESLQWWIAEDFSVSTDPLALEKLVEIAHRSNSAELRLKAIHGLGRNPQPKGTMELISLLRVTFPKDLRLPSKWSSEHGTIDAHLMETVRNTLEKRTRQKLGTDPDRWARWWQSEGTPGRR